MHFSKFAQRFPEVNIGPLPWRKGETKETNPSLLKLSSTLKAKRVWNFSKWQKERRRFLINQYKELSRDINLAELIGIILGDGNLSRMPRTENLRIICNSKDTTYIRHISELIAKIFHKAPSIINRKSEHATVISLYQCRISNRLELPCGNKIKNNICMPSWVFLNNLYTSKCLKGLFETDGCFYEEKDNYTQVIEFKNYCIKLRHDVYNALLKLGFNPQLGSNYVRLAKKEEVRRFKELIDFKNYN